MDPKAREHYVVKCLYRDGIKHDSPIFRTYFVEFANVDHRVAPFYASLTKEGWHDSFDVPSRERVRQTLAALAMQHPGAAQLDDHKLPDMTLVCGDREQALVDPNVPLAPLEHADLRDTWWATPGFLRSWRRLRPRP